MSSELHEKIVRTFETLIQRIEEHASYGPALRAAAERSDQLVLDYHTHGPGEPYCVSIAAQGFALEALGQEPPLLELAHVRGVGEAEEQCEVLMTILAERLMDHYDLDRAPLLYLNGGPFQPDAD